ncbi:MAG: SDR family oxidoreductase [Chitinophagaceae bacterium]|nr:MAG: SDR family oxidoreductase [Chitinophagaceae bacterium]
MSNEKKYTLITGGSGGIGFELAKIFAKNGHHLILVSRDQVALEKAAAFLQQQYHTEVLVISKDLFIQENASALYGEVKGRGLQVDILVNDAGQGLYGEFADTALEKELAIINLNIASLVTLTKFFLKDMLQRGEGKILNLSSIASRLPGPWQSVYHATKAFVQSFTEAVREEVKDKGIVITALLPGATDTDFFRKAGMLQSKVVQEGKLAPAGGVAQAGYDALMKGDDMVVAGAMNKMQAAMAAITPDETLAAKMYKQQAPVGHEEDKK